MTMSLHMQMVGHPIEKTVMLHLQTMVPLAIHLWIVEPVAINITLHQYVKWGHLHVRAQRGDRLRPHIETGGAY